MAFLERNANRGSISTGFNIDHSLKVENDNREYIRWTDFSTQGSEARKKKFSMSCWLKRTELGRQMIFWSTSQNGYFAFDAADTVVWYQQYVGSGTQIGLRTTRKFRDIGAWYHFMIVVDTAQSTEANRVKMYVNGVQETSFGTPNTYPSQNAQASNLYEQHLVLGEWGGGSTGFSGYIAEYYFLSEIAASPTDLGEYDEDTGIWKPKAYDGTISSPSHFLEFKDGSDLGTATSGLDGDYLENITAADQATDTPTNNFCTLNPIAYNTTYTATEGNTKWSKSDTTYGMASGTHYVGAGKWYWEVKATDFNTYSSCQFGIVDANKPNLGPSENGYEDPSLSADNPEILVMVGSPNGWYMNSNSTISNNGSTNSVDYTFNEGDIIAIALDMDNGGYWMGNSRYSGVNNGSFWIAPGGTTTSGSVATTDPSNGNYALVGDGGGTNSGTPNFNGGSINGGSLLTAGFTLVTPTIGAYHSNTTVTLEVNFGGFTSYAEDGGYADANGYGNFAYAVPSGFYSLCSKNIAEFGGSG